MKKPVLYVQEHSEIKRRLAFDFCYSALLGAAEAGIKCKTFRDSLTIPFERTSIIVGSVEQSHRWLKAVGVTVPSAIALEKFNADHLGRKIERASIQEARASALADFNSSKFTNFFIKPSRHIKGFTGFIVDDPRLISLWSENFDGEVYKQDVVDIVSEYRLYVSLGKMLGMFHYSGDYFKYPNPEIIKAVKCSADDLGYQSYTLDFGVLADGRTILIEANDAYAIGNYGLEPSDYYQFVKNRWLQITGVRKSF